MGNNERKSEKKREKAQEQERVWDEIEKKLYKVNEEKNNSDTKH